MLKKRSYLIGTDQLRIIDALTLYVLALILEYVQNSPHSPHIEIVASVAAVAV